MKSEKPARHRARRRLTIRMRLTLTYAGLITGSGAVLITLVYLYMRFVPSYQIVPDQGATRPEGSSFGRAQPVDAIAIASADDFLENLLLASGVALIVMAVLGGVVGWLVAGRIVRPLGEIGEAARRATEGSLDHRVGLSGPPDEIQNLADTFDQMLASLERSFTAQRRFTANASHELQSPLATIKTMIDVALSDPAPDLAGLRGLVERISEVNQSNIEAVGAMLDLATAENSTVLPEPVDLVLLSQIVVADVRDDAASLHVQLQGPTGRAVAWGSPVLVRQAVSNLLRNAVHHNHAGGYASISVSSSQGRARLAVSNSGPTVAAAELGTLVEPFTRGAGRSLTRGSGHGLGLAIADAAIAANDGTLHLAPNADGGLTATIELPSADIETEVQRSSRR